MADPKGATPAEWFHFDFVLGLGGNLLPCVPAGPDVKVKKGSALEGKVGKIPSMFNREGEAHGLTEWQKRPILSNEVQLWSADPRLNICVRTGPISGVYAIDCDVDDLALSTAIQNEMVLAFLAKDNIVGEWPIRARSNSHKWLFPFKLEGGTCKKRKIWLRADHKGPAIELLADGQQFVAAGLHSSGVPYQWRPGLPQQLPSMTLEQLNRMWQALTSKFAAETPSTATPTTASASATLSTSTAISTETSSLSPGSTPLDSSTSQLLSAIDASQWNDLISALRSLIPHAGSNDLWSEIGYALLSLKQTPVGSAYQLWCEFSRKADGYEDGAPEKWWKDHESQPTRTDYRHIFTLARQRGWGATSSPESFEPVVPKPKLVGSGEGVPALSVSDPDSPADDMGDDLAPPPLPDRPLVRVSVSNFSEIVDQLERILEPCTYSQGAHLVRPSEAHTVEEIERSAQALMLIPVAKAWARWKLGKLCQFQRFASAKGVWYDVDPSAEHANALLELGGWNIIKPLDAIARAPFIRPDGSICDTPGYDNRARALLVPRGTFPALPADPGKRDAHAALERLRGIFDQFPWKNTTAESAFLAHVLTEAARLAFPKAPMFWYSAPAAGTGKSLLQNMASIIVHGNIPSKRPWVGDADEIRKTIYASLLAGDRSVLFDNVPEGLKVRSAELCAILTTGSWQDRKLGVSEAPSVANRACISASGNNVTPVGDLARRSIVIRLDANTEFLAEREFKISDIESHVLEHRPEILIDVLTIIRAYHESGHADYPRKLPGYEPWSHFVRDPLLWLDLPDPVDSQKDETDDEKVSLGDVFLMLHKNFGDRPFTSIDIAKLAGSIMDAEGALTQALLQNGCSEPNSPQKLGYWLRGQRDKVASGYKLVPFGRVRAGVTFQLTPIIKELT